MNYFCLVLLFYFTTTVCSEDRDSLNKVCYIVKKNIGVYVNLVHYNFQGDILFDKIWDVPDPTAPKPKALKLKVMYNTPCGYSAYVYDKNNNVIVKAYRDKYSLYTSHVNGTTSCLPMERVKEDERPEDLIKNEKLFSDVDFSETIFDIESYC